MIHGVIRSVLKDLKVYITTDNEGKLQTRQENFI
jgi:hypothetical protein